MKLIIRSILLAFVLYFVHLLIFGVFSSFIFEKGGYYSFAFGIVYGLIFAFWAYWLLCYIYLRMTKTAELRKERYIKAVLIVLIGYFLSRIPDIIDGNFINNFKWWSFIIFILLIPVLVELGKLFSRPKGI